MKLTLSLLSLFAASVFLNAGEATKESNNEFTYIQPVAVEEAPVKEVVETKSQEMIQEEAPVEQKQKQDQDADGIADENDKCPDTSKEFVVDGYGCPQTATLKVTFETNSYAISEELINDLKEFAQFLQDNIGYQVVVYGYTDSSGNDELNKKLSQNRAESVKEALTRYGISEIRLTAIGKGEENPVADNSTKEGRAANRRIEVELLQ
jgi:OOP family OmpA-OmpF porin